MKQWAEEAIGGMQKEGEHILANLQRLKIKDSTDKIMVKDSLGLQGVKESHSATVCASSWGYVIHSLTTGFHNLLKKRPPSVIMLLNLDLPPDDCITAASYPRRM
jgi:hypothetical protein